MSVIQGLNKYMSRIATVLGILGIVTFSQFILEEAIQLVTFSTWAAQDARRWDLVEEGRVKIHQINEMLRWVTNTIGLVQPLGFLSYHQYVVATETYEQALIAKIMVHDPTVLEGKELTLWIKPLKIEVVQRPGPHYRIRTRQMVIDLKPGQPEPQVGKRITVQGIFWLDHSRPRIKAARLLR